MGSGDGFVVGIGMQDEEQVLKETEESEKSLHNVRVGNGLK